MKKAVFFVLLSGFMIIGAMTFIAAYGAVEQCEEVVDSANRDDPREVEVNREQAIEECLFGDDTRGDLGGDEGEGSEGASPPGGLQNGRLPFSMLERVSSHGDYDCLVASYNGAAGAWRQLVMAAQAQGIDIEGGWCYRTYEAQAAAWNSRRCFVPGNCDGNPYPPTAPPGKSNHGWGLAIDVWNAWDTILSCSDPEFFWMQRNAPSFGWEHPGWARCGQGSQEPWHWEYVG